MLLHPEDFQKIEAIVEKAIDKKIAEAMSQKAPEVSAAEKKEAK